MLIFSKIVFAPSPTNFLPQSFGKTSVFDKAQSNKKAKTKIKTKTKTKILGQTTWIWFGRQNMGT